jgi:alpha-galactosidase
MSSPLLAGNNLSAATPELISILTAKGPLGANQDSLALQGTLCDTGNDNGGIWQAWSKPLSGAATAAVIVNRNCSGTVRTTLNFTKATNGSTSGKMVVVDLWTNMSLGVFDGAFSADIAPHAHRMLKLTPSK